MQLPKNDAELKDPKSEDSIQPEYAKNEMRSRRADVLVLIGICTHLGCLPKQFFDAGRSGARRRAGRAAFAVPATVRASIWPAGCSTAHRPDQSVSAAVQLPATRTRW